MAKFVFYEIKCMKYLMEQDKFGRPIDPPKEMILDTVHLQFDKKIANSTMRGVKADAFSVSIADLPFVFLKPEVKFPAIAGNGDCTARIEAVHEFLTPYLDGTCIAEVTTKSNGKALLASVEFD